MADLYPEIEPHDHGLRDVGDGNLIYWEVCGNPEGKPVVVLHGGPGSGCSNGMRRYFDPAVYRIILFDQRNCGRSKPHASDRGTDLSLNTTNHLLADMEALRRYCNIACCKMLAVCIGRNVYPTVLSSLANHPGTEGSRPLSYRRDRG